MASTRSLDQRPLSAPRSRARRAAPDAGTAAPAVRASPVASSAGGERTRIVLVEDNPADVYLIQQELERLPGLDLVHYGNGDDALRALQPPPDAVFHRPDLVFLDLRLPGIAGHEILRVLRSEPRMKDVPIVIISGASPSQLSPDDLAGADLFVHKSLDLDQYLANIRHAVLTLARR